MYQGRRILCIVRDQRYGLRIQERLFGIARIVGAFQGRGELWGGKESTPEVFEGRIYWCNVIEARDVCRRVGCVRWEGEG